MTFEALGLDEPLLRALDRQGYARPTPIQHRAIPPVLAGHDLLGCAQTGTGKTAAFALPILQILAEAPARSGRRAIRALVVTPTRELAAQIAENLTEYGHYLPLRHAVIFGGVNQRPQEQSLRRGVDILVATPGRLLDLIGQGIVSLGDVEILVLDEADRMLDMGFINDIRRILSHVPDDRQTLLFSATMPTEIQRLADTMLYEPEHVSVAPRSAAADTVEQYVYLVEKSDKPALLRSLLDDPEIEKALVFTRTKHGANRVAKALGRVHIEAAAIHGNKSQSARTRALTEFKNGDIQVLVASDIASRGLDIDDISHVVNFDLPNVPEVYVHRIGRTGRAGAVGVALSFCDRDEREYLRDIERLVDHPVTLVEDHAFAPAWGRLPSASTPQQRSRPPARSGQQPRASGANGAGSRTGDRPRRRRRPRPAPAGAAASPRANAGQAGPPRTSSGQGRTPRTGSGHAAGDGASGRRRGEQAASGRRRGVQAASGANGQRRGGQAASGERGVGAAAGAPRARRRRRRPNRQS